MATSGALVEPCSFPGMGRGLRVTRDVVEGEELLAVPLADCWHAADARRMPELRSLGVSLGARGEALSELDAVALQLLIERSKGEAAVRAAHIRDIPASYPTVPLFWSEAELSALRGSAWEGLARRYVEEAHGDWASLRALVGDEFLRAHAIGIDGYLWAYATIKSRAVAVRAAPPRATPGPPSPPPPRTHARLHVRLR